MKGTKWSKKEENYLYEAWGTISKNTIAEKLGRSVVAINLKAKRMNLGPFLESGDYISLNQLMIQLRGNYVGKQYTIDQWIDKGLRVKTQRIYSDSFRVINLEDFWKWAKKNRTIIDFSKLRPLTFGKEPDWLIKQRKIDKENDYFKKTPWTKSEDRKLQMMLNEYKYTYRELSLSLKRTEGAIKKRLTDLNIKNRPIRMPNHNPWTEEETQLLIDLYHKGHNRNTFPNYINRSAQACGGKIERLIKDGIISPRNTHRKTC